jgi:hypothetical protein
MALLMAVGAVAGAVWMQRNVFGPLRSARQTQDNTNAKDSTAGTGAGAGAGKKQTSAAVGSAGARQSQSEAEAEAEADEEHPLLASLYLNPHQLPPHFRAVLPYGLPTPLYTHSPHLRIRPTYICW